VARNTIRPDSRLAAVHAIMAGRGVEALLFLDLKNIRYLTGFSGSDAALLVSEDQTVLLVDGRYTTQARKQTRSIRVFEYREKAMGIVQIASDLRVKTLGFEAAAITYDFYANLLKKLKNIKLRAITEDHLGGLRSIKSRGEIAFIKRAVQISTRALEASLPLIKPGVRETDIALELDYRIRQEGAEALSFETIVASGENGALPHAKPGFRKLKKGDLVVIDFGAVYGGYHSDETCTFGIGRLNRSQKEAYEAVKEAHDRAMDAIRAGAACREIDGIARRCLEKRGYGKYFSHGTGHGIGLDVHETPRLSIASNGDLRDGMVVTVEPGIYIPGRWGIRLEDSVLVKKGGHEVLTRFPKDLRIL
jgi:Xaa-Pro aminopeptidase/Xaa-Pro dipeptidase